MMKKAQMEVLGLAVIVIIVSLGIFFLISFSGEPEKFHKGFSDEQTIKNLLTSMKRTTVEECRSLDIGELLVNCEEDLGKYDTLRTSGSSDLCASGKTTCLVANQTIYYLLNSTMNRQELSFHFKVFKYDAQRFWDVLEDKDEWIITIMDKGSRGCKGKDKKVAGQPIPYGFSKSLYMNLEVCE